jgi:uncharacterized protein
MTAAPCVDRRDVERSPRTPVSRRFETMRFIAFAALVAGLVVTAPLQAQSSAATHKTQEITFASGDVMIAATLLTPPGDGPFPGVVIVHGSGASDRNNPWTSAYASALVARGIAVLHPDKRGAGGSTGNWRAASLGDLAGDVQAGLLLLRQHVLVDSTRVGAIGFSQGGHVVAMTASRTPEVRFAIAVSSGVVSMHEQIADEVRMMGVEAGLTAAQLAMADSLNVAAIRYAVTGEGWAQYADALARARSGPVGETRVIQGFPTDRESPAWSYLRQIADYDPLPWWKSVRVPTLFLYGGRDRNVDVFKSAALIERELTEAGLPYALLLFRNNGHGIFREDAMDLVARWIRDGGKD